MARGVADCAQWGSPTETVYDSGYASTLYASGTLVRDGGWGGRILLADGTGSRMIAACSGRLYVLKNNGNIWMHDGAWRMIDNGTGTARIWVDWGTVYAQKNTGQTWRCVDPYSMSWQPTNGGGWRNMARVQNFEKLTAVK